MDDVARRKAAFELAQARYGFFWHFPIYVIVNAGFVALWFYGGQGFFWPIFPMASWGLGVVAHYLSAFRSFGRAWIAKETERLLRESKV